MSNRSTVELGFLMAKADAHGHDMHRVEVCRCDRCGAGFIYDPSSGEHDGRALLVNCPATDDRSSVRVHDLKCWREHFRRLLDGTKHVELRFDDREFKVGDRLLLREYDPRASRYTGRATVRRVSHILRSSDGPWLSSGYVALSLEPGGVLPDQLQQAFADGRRSVLGDLTEDDAAVERGNR